MKKLPLLITFLVFAFYTKAQKFGTETAQVVITSSNYPEIKGVNDRANTSLDLMTGELVVVADVRDFQFEKSSTKKHFNQDMVSKTYPTTKFVGKIVGFSKLRRNGKYDVQVKGKLTIKDLSKNEAFVLPLTVRDGKITGSTRFNIDPADYEYAAKNGESYAARKEFQEKAPKASIKISLNLSEWSSQNTVRK